MILTSSVRRTLAAVLGAAILAGALPVLLQSQGRKRLAIAAASDLQAVLPEIVRGFERAASATVTVSYGSSGNFFAQIQNGAPFDLFLSADVDYPRQLAAAGLADPSTLQIYARGHLVVWTRRETRIDLGRGLASLTDSRVRHVAIANPAFAPYGRAAVAALRSAGLYEVLQPKLVMGENLAQTAQLVQSGNAEAGILSRSLALGPTLKADGTSAEVPAASYPPIDQAGVVVKAARDPALARSFLAYLRRADAVAQLERSGFTLPRR